MQVVSGKEMQEIDKISIKEIGILGVVLMEHAGFKAAMTIMERFKKPLSVLIIAGKGNNGGDGFVIHRWLKHWGYNCTTLLLTSREEIKGDARVNLDILINSGEEIVEIHNEAELKEFMERVSNYGLIVDGILGTGLRGEVRGLSRLAIELVNSVSVPVVSIDIPSGLDSVTGHPLGDAIRAEMTITFGLPKMGLLLYPGQKYTGDLRVVDIGIPEKVIAKMNIKRFLMNADLCRNMLAERPPEGHKGTFGKVVVLAGSTGLTGAAALCSEAVLRSGAGLVTLGIPQSVNSVLEVKLTEVMTRPLPEEDGKLSIEGLDEIIDLTRGADVVTVGPGLGKSIGLEKIIETLINEVKKPLVIDADGLNNIKSVEILKDRQALTVLTPHPGEMARLLNVTVPEVTADPIGIAENFAKEYGIILVLKGAPTVTVIPGSGTYINSTGNEGMGTGGTGDVLTGVISGLLAQKIDPLSVVAGVYLHGLAGDIVVQELTSQSLLAGDLLRGLSMAFKTVEN